MEARGEPAALVTLRCIGCGVVASQPGGGWRCGCGDLLEAVLPEPVRTGLVTSALRERWRARRISPHPSDQSGVWRFRELVPILREPSSAVTLREGNSALYSLPRCARGMGLAELWAKHQGLNPTGSFKDLGMTAAVSRAREDGFGWLACASTGNTSASMAAYAARAGLRSLVLVPAGQIAWAKLAQALDFGALTCQLQADFDGCVRVLDEVVAQTDVCLVNSVNPYRVEGQKTAAFEMAEALDWQVPDHLIVPGGNLANVSALGKGFVELQAAGFIDRLPRLSVIQAEGANPFVRSWRDHGGRQLTPIEAHTFASAIRIGKPASWKKAARVLELSGGTCLDVSEGEIAQAKIDIGLEGVGCEPASAAALAGARKLLAQGHIIPGQSVVLILTGHALKDPDYTLSLHRGTLLTGADRPTVNPPRTLDADVTAVLRAMATA